MRTWTWGKVEVTAIENADLKNCVSITMRLNGCDCDLTVEAEQESNGIAVAHDKSCFLFKSGVLKLADDSG